MAICPVCRTVLGDAYEHGEAAGLATGAERSAPGQSVDYCPAPGCGAVLGRPLAETLAWAVRMTVEGRGLAVGPGQSGRLRVRVRNAGMHADEYRLEVAGLPPAWVQVRPDVLALEPRRVGDFSITCAIPRDPAIAPSVLHSAVYAASRRDPNAHARALFGLRVRSFVAPVIVPAREEVHGRKRVRTSLVLRNDGNVPTRVWLRAHDPSGRVTAACQPRAAELQPGESVNVDARLMFWTGRVLGRPRRSTVWFVADAGTVTRRTAIRCEQRSLIPRWFYRIFRIAAREMAAHHGLETAVGEAAAGAARSAP